MKADTPKKLSLNQKCINYKYILYVLKLEKGRYYVGKSKDEETLKERLKNHREGKGKGAEWTKMYPVVAEMKDLYEYNRSPFEEDRKVKELMYIFGTNMVRGGTYSRTIDLSPEQSFYILKEFKGATDECYHCGEHGHFIKFCPKMKKQKEQKKKKKESGHEQGPIQKKEEQVEALVQKKGRQKKEEKKYDFLPICSECHGYGHYKCDFNQYGQEYKKKYKEYVRCWSCNQYGHFADQCDEQSSYWSDSDPWSEDWSDSSDEIIQVRQRSREKKGIACYICGNPNHLKPDCPFNDKYKYKKRQYFTESRTYRSNTCNYCKKEGHWYANCWLRQNNRRPYDEDSDSDDNSL